MIAQPFKVFHVFGDKVFEGSRDTLQEFFHKHPKYLEDLLWNKPWLLICQEDFEILEMSKPQYRFRTSTKIFNQIKLEIFNCFVENLRRYVYPDAEDWEYLIHFNKNYNNLFEDYIGSSYNTSLTWIIDEENRYIDLDKLFISEPEKVERMLVFNGELFLDEDNMNKLLACNPSFKLSQRAILWNDLRNENHTERREYDQEQSRLDWELRKALGEV